ncbi:MAG: 50S ribosomal protein L20 [Phycisphaerae bacterium]|nr:50S ribosomal protein L20 [Phycisphaerae bacterium]
MARVKGGFATRHRRKRILKDAKGFRGTHRTHYKNAKQTVYKAGVYAFRDRRAKKRNFRSLWIIRVAAACEERGVNYSRFLGALRKANVVLNRKMLSEIAIHDPKAFDKLLESVRKHIPAEAA